MAFLGQDDKQLGADPNAQQNGSAIGGGSTAPLVNNGGSGVGSGAPVSTAGVGAGGSGWTNIQSYLSANQGNTGSSDALNKEVGGSFDQDKQNLSKQANDTQSQANAQTQRNNISQDQTSQLISQAGNQYNYNGAQSDAYNQSVQPLKDAYGAQYAGPNQFAYGMSGKTQTYGSDLNPKNEQGFQGLMNSIYDQAAGGQMNTGQYALQSQIDASNGTLAQTRSDLGNRYQALNNYAYGSDGQHGLVGDTNTAIHNAQNQMITNHGNLNTWLNSMSGNDRGQIDNAMNAWNSDEGNLANMSGLAAMPGLHGNQTVAVPDPRNPNTNVTAGNLNADTYWQYQPGAQANEANIGGVTAPRGQFNSIMDILGSGDRINQSPGSISHGTYNFDQGGYNNAITGLQNAYIQSHIPLSQPTHSQGGIMTGPSPTPYNPQGPNPSSRPPNSYGNY